MQRDEIWDELNETKRRVVPAWLVRLLVFALLLLTAGLLAYYYLTGGDAAPTAPSKAPPSATPIPGANGEPSLLDAYFIDVGNGDCFFARAVDGKTILVDAGSENDADEIVALLESLEVSRIDALFVSLPDARHIGGMAKIAETFAVGACYMTKECAASPLSEPLRSALATQDVEITEVMASFTSVIDWAENVELRILSPHDVGYESEEDRSLMLRIAYGDSRILLAGDAHKLAERMTVKALPNRLLHADVLKVGDHGDGSATSDKFLSAVKPKIAVISCGGKKLPDDTVLVRLEARGIMLLRTDTLGTIHITLDGASAQVVQ